MGSNDIVEKNFNEKLNKLIEQAPEDKRPGLEKELDGFRKIFSKFLSTKNEIIEWEKIKPAPQDMVIPYDSLPELPEWEEERTKLAEKLIVVKLNGGLGTTMGCTGPKSVIEVRQEKTFLDITLEQIREIKEETTTSVPLVLMNSFNTHKDTEKIIQKYKNLNLEVRTFNQSCYPRIYKESLLPVPDTPDVLSNPDAWYPPGHGDIFVSFANSGLLDHYLAQGKEYMFISNIDNLGATVDLTILNYLLKNNVEYCMEVTDKTRSDVKGGTLIEYEGSARLFEIAQCPSSKVDEFKSIKKFKIFNTNNLWVNLKAIARVVKEGTLSNVELIVNPKKLQNGSNCLQIETAAGAAIRFFKNAKGINVKRNRFLPVKSTSDLFVLQSNLYTLENGNLILNPKRVFPTLPLVKLGDHFTKVPDYMRRIHTVPDILELDQLTVSGDVTFGTGIALKGSVIVVANAGSRIDIPPGSVLENKVITGNMRLLEH